MRQSKTSFAILATRLPMKPKPIMPMVRPSRLRPDQIGARAGPAPAKLLVALADAL